MIPLDSCLFQKKPLKNKFFICLAIFYGALIGHAIPVTPKGTALDIKEETLILQKRVGYQPTNSDESGLLPLTLSADSESPATAGLRNARIAAQQGHIERAESLYLKLLEKEMPLTERLDILIEYGNLYQKNSQKVKYSAVLENFVALAKGDPRLPMAYLELGRTYRDIGDFKKSLAAFNNVLNASLMGAEVNMEAFKKASLQAKIEMTETYFAMGDIAEAKRSLKRLQTLELSDADREKIMFQSITLRFNEGDYANVLPDLKMFITQYPQSQRLCEARFLLASAYRKQGQFETSLQEVLTLLQDDRLNKDVSPDVLLYWRGKAGNQIGNAFYEQGDYMNALSIYQAMLPLHAGPIWQWPVLYQIGLCYERLKMYDKAKNTYQEIASPTTSAHFVNTPLSPSLNATQESAKWRLNQMEWSKNMTVELSKLTPPDTTLKL